MKKLILFGLVALLAIGLSAPPARAVTLPPGEMAASAVDNSSLYEFVNDAWTPIATGSEPAEDNEQRSVFSIDAINFGSIGGDAFGPYVDASPSAVPYTSNTLAGMVYDLVISDVTDSGSTFPDLEFVGGGRYTSDGSGDDGTWTDQVLSPTYGGVTTGLGWGGLLVVYEVPADSADFDGGDGGQDGQTDWMEGTGGATADSALTAQDEFPTISGSEPWLIATFGPLFVGSSTVLIEDGTGNGFQGVGYANVIGGTFASLVRLDAFGPLMDLRLDFEVQVPIDDGSIVLTGDGWQTNSDDPISIAIVPEPATMSLLGLSLLGLAGAGWRKKK